MVELVLFIVIVGIAVAGILMVMIQSNKASADPQLRKQAISIAEGLLEEIQLARFTYCDPGDDTAEEASGAFVTDATGTPIGCKKWVETVGPEKRNVNDADDQRNDDMRPYDNVNDYVTAFSNEELFPLTDLNEKSAGELTPGNNADANLLKPYTAFLTITPESLGSGTGLIASDASAAGNDVLRIRVRVHYASEDVVLDGYRTRYAPNAVP
jgi:MSHA pilin protein MshD